MNDDNEYVPRDLDSYLAGDVVEELIASLDRRRQRNKRVLLRCLGLGFVVGGLIAGLLGDFTWVAFAIDLSLCAICWVLSFVLWKEG